MADPNQYVTIVHPNDVLFGRGSGPNDHEGNIRFRDMVAQRKPEYMATNHRQTKAKIARTIVDTVLACNGRFLKKLEPAEIQKLGCAAGMDIYQVVDDDTIMEKAKQALRQNRDKTSTGSNPSMEKNAELASLAVTQGVTSAGQDLPPVFVQGNQGQFGMHLSTGPVVHPVPSYSMDEEGVYCEDADGYATYTTILDDHDDDQLFDEPSPAVQRRLSGTRRGSLLGGRKGEGGRRESLQMADVWRRDSILSTKVGESMQMSELMESFKGMSTSGDMNSSTDTIGTIEGNIYGASQMSGLSNMSVFSMASTGSLFKANPKSDISSPNDSDDNGGEDFFPGPTSGEWNNHGMNKLRQSEMPPPGSTNHRGSMIPRDAWNSEHLESLLRAPIEGSSSLLTMDSSAGISRSAQLSQEQPDSLGFLGSSSMSGLLRADDQLSTSFDTGNDFSSPNRILPPERR